MDGNISNKTHDTLPIRARAAARPLTSRHGVLVPQCSKAVEARIHGIPTTKTTPFVNGAGHPGSTVQFPRHGSQQEHLITSKCTECPLFTATMGAMCVISHTRGLKALLQQDMRKVLLSETWLCVMSAWHVASRGSGGSGMAIHAGNGLKGIGGPPSVWLTHGKALDSSSHHQTLRLLDWLFDTAVTYPRYPTVTPPPRPENASPSTPLDTYCHKARQPICQCRRLSAYNLKGISPVCTMRG